MIAGPGTNREGGSRVPGTGRERRNGPARGRNRYDASSHHPKPSPLSFLFLFFTFLLPRVDERTSSRIGSCHEEKSENPHCVVQITKRSLRGSIRKQGGKDRHGAHDEKDAAHA